MEKDRDSERGSRGNDRVAKVRYVVALRDLTPAETALKAQDRDDVAKGKVSGSICVPGHFRSQRH